MKPGYFTKGIAAVARWASLLAAAGAIAGCQAPTQIALQVSTDVPYAAGRTIAFTTGSVGQVESRPPNVVTDTVWGADGKVGSLILVPSGGDSDALELKVTMGIGRSPEGCSINDANGCIFTRRQLSFIPNKSLTLPIGIFANCEGKPCEANTTCNALGTCVAKAIDSNQCASGANACVVHGDDVLVQSTLTPHALPDAGSAPDDCRGKPAGYVCRALTGICDMAETCDGVAPSCPADSLMAAGSVCRAAIAGGCDVAETCDGIHPYCPADVTVAPGKELCRPAVSSCDLSECRPAGGVCPADSFVVSGLPCDTDNDACTLDKCNGLGVCGHAADGACTACTKVALAPVVVVASSSIAPNAEANAIDSDSNTFWQSALTDPSWIYVDLGSDKHISEVVVDGNLAADTYAIEVAPDGTCAGTGAGCLGTDAAWVQKYLPPLRPASARHTEVSVLSWVGRYVRVLGTARADQTAGYELYDFRVNGDANTACGR
ncbi:MAG TPA: discoidin domain-containing protein [Polyangiaceae bacterium]|nr:discoidin domain-containing protein [Polyangiaceae bacterium]